MLKQYEAQAVHSHTGFLTFTQEYAMLHGSLPFSRDRARGALSHAFYSFSLLDICMRR